MIATANAESSSTSSIPLSLPNPSPSASNVKLLWSALLKGGTITGRKLFDNEHRLSISDEINATRKRDLISSKQHVGMMNARLKAMWDDLKEEQRDWEDKAAVLRASEEKDLLYRYVSKFTALVPSRIDKKFLEIKLSCPTMSPLS